MSETLRKGLSHRQEENWKKVAFQASAISNALEIAECKYILFFFQTFDLGILAIFSNWVLTSYVRRSISNALDIELIEGNFKTQFRLHIWDEKGPITLYTKFGGSRTWIEDRSISNALEIEVIEGKSKT